MRLSLIVGALLLCFSMTLGCGSVGKEFNLDQVQTIENGKTTREDIASHIRTAVQSRRPEQPSYMGL